MQRLGQHFLKNKSQLTRIASALAITDGQDGRIAVVEIGPGHGELTDILLDMSVKKITLIEKDAALCRVLENKFQNNDRITLCEGDALNLLPSAVKDLAPAAYKLVGNIPYYITGKLLRTVGELEHKPVRTVLLLQREVAERICAHPPRMNRLAASVQFWAEPKILGHVPREDFSPPPDVDSSIILLESKDSSSDAAPYYRAVRAIFAQPRKTLFNNLRAVQAGGDKEKDAKLEASNLLPGLLQKIGIAPECRPQDLSIEQIEAIAEALF